MANPFCCRGKLGALPLILIGFLFLMSWHFMSEIFIDMGDNRSIRGSHKGSLLSDALQKIENEIAMVQERRDQMPHRQEGAMIQQHRDIDKESDRRPAHIRDQVIEMEADTEQRRREGRMNEVEMMAAGEGEHDADQIVIAGKAKIDQHVGEPLPKAKKQEFRDREAAAEVVEAAEAQGGVVQDDAMNVAKEEEAKPPAVDEGPAVAEALESDQGVEALPIIVEGKRLAERVKLEISIDGVPATPLVLKMFTKEAPLTVSNFETICNGNYTNEAGSTLPYDGVKFHRIIKDFMLQGGQISVPGNHSHYGKNWADEKSGLALPHAKKGTLSMANAGPNTNSSQFFITFKDTPHLDGKHAVFGELESGFDTLDKVNEIEMSQPVVLTKCHLMY